VLFFASEEAAFVTGESLYVAGGARDVPASAIRPRKESQR
jgi:hypothetical protein